MNKLKRFDKDGIELIIDTQTGESFASVSGYARISGKDKSTISRRLHNCYKGVDKIVLKPAKVQTTGGIQGVALIPEDLISQWIVKDNPELAGKMLQAGVRVFLHKLAGYQVTSSIVEQSKSPAEVALAMAQALVDVEHHYRYHMI